MRCRPGSCANYRPSTSAAPRHAVTARSGSWATCRSPRGCSRLLGPEHHIVRSRNEALARRVRRGPSWRTGGEAPAALPADQGYAELVRRWLYAFGPGTEADLVWWLGSTKAAVRTALRAVEAVPVTYDSGDVGYVLPGDEAPDGDDPDGDWAPAAGARLDLMGWKQRDFYLDPALAPYLFDTNGNGGASAWLNGRVVGCWVQDDDGRVVVLPATRLTKRHRNLLHDEADRLTTFLGATVITNVYKSRLMKGERLP
ncbi:MAG: crosslink repair DNA glycosylase YcaQ family protein [Micropruina glycogenica]